LSEVNKFLKHFKKKHLEIVEELKQLKEENENQIDPAIMEDINEIKKYNPYASFVKSEF